MENLVPLGTGNSRFMKSNIPASTTLAQLIQMLNNGTFPYDVGPINPAGISQQGTPLNKATLLQDATCALLGLPNTAVPNDAFAKLALGTSMYGYLITVVDGFGHPMEGLTVSGIQSRTGGACVTDENGQALGVSTETSVSVSVTSPYFDLDSASQTVQSTGIITSATLQMAVKYAENQAVTLRTSQTVQFSPVVAEVDFCAVGGGGGAGGPTMYFGGGGGAGGYAVNLLNQTPSSGDAYSFAIGAGGTPGHSAGGHNNGDVGGTTTIKKGKNTILTANGGSGGKMSASSAAIGNGNGGFAMNTFFGYPTKGTVNLFEDAALGLAGGGGGGSGASIGSSSGNPSHSPTAGAGPYGASGTNRNSNGSSATGPGGGGGGAGCRPGGGTSYGGEGADGAVILRMRYVS